MQKWLAVAAVSVGLVFSGMASGTAEAGGGGGRSFSSGRSVSFSSSGRSFSSGGSLSGKSYSSGSSFSKTISSSRPSLRPNPSKPPVRSNPAPPSARPSPSRPPPSTNPNKPVDASNSRASTRSYSSGASPGPNGAPTGRRYSSGNTTVSGKSYAAGSGSSTKPSSGSFDVAAARSQRMAESKQAFLKGQQPKPSYTDQSGVSHPIRTGDPEIASLRRELDRQRWETRELRRRAIFGGYYTSTPPVVVYHDPYSNLFWWWLLSRSLDEQSYWAYNHRQSMDEKRYHDLLAHDANLEARIHQLEAEHVPRDPTYRPDHIDPDLMYSNSYVEAVYNPQPRVSAPFRAMLTVLIVLAVLVLIIWLVFYKRWGGIGG